jgi:hypothetical protein
MFGSFFNKIYNKGKNIGKDFKINAAYTMDDYLPLRYIACAIGCCIGLWCGVVTVLSVFGEGVALPLLGMFFGTISGWNCVGGVFDNVSNFLNDDHNVVNHYVASNNKEGLAYYLGRVQRFIPHSMEVKCRNAVLKAVNNQNTNMVKYLFEEQQIFNFHARLGTNFNKR